MVVIDDGSTDRTAEISRRYAHVLHHPFNLGQGAALQTGFDYCRGIGAEVVVTFDADNQMRADEIPNLVGPLLDGRADVVLGSRFLSKSTDAPRLRRFILKLSTFISRWSTGLPITDSHNGLRALSKNALSQIQIRQNRMAHASELLHQIARAKLRVTEVPVTIQYSKYSMKKGQSSWGALEILWDLIFKEK